MQYAALLHVSPSAPDWPRLQSQLRNLGNFTLSEHAKWAMIAPVLLRSCLTNAQLRSHFLSTAHLVAGENIAKLMSQAQSDGGNQMRQPVSLSIFDALAANTRSTMLLMSPSLTFKERADFDTGIRVPRGTFQHLNEIVERESITDPYSRAVSPTTHARSQTPNLSEVDIEIEQGSRATIRSEQYEQVRCRPKVHTDLNDKVMRNECGEAGNFNISMSEDKHRHVYDQTLCNYHD